MNFRMKEWEMNEYEIEELIKVVEKDGMITAPHYLKENILAESTQLKISTLRQTHILSAKVQLILYSLKITAAVACAIFLLGVINIDSSQVTIGTGHPTKEVEQTENSVTRTLNQKSNQMSSVLCDFSNSLINWR